MSSMVYTPTLPPVSELLQEDAARLIAECLGKGWRICNWIKLNHKLETQVARLTLSNHYGEEKTVILKYFHSDLYADPMQWAQFREFLEEKVNYQYLEKLRGAFPYFAKCYGQLPGMLLLEDLGQDAYVFDSLEEILKALAHTFLMLHHATRPTRTLYEQSRLAACRSADTRRYSISGSGNKFDEGCKIMSRFFSILGLPVARLEELLTEVRELIMTESVFWSFIHDDLADRRQSIVIAGQVYLVDFEHGKFFHSLIDLSKLLMGKVERDYSRQAGIYNHPNVPTAIGETYYQAWCEAGDAPSREEWDRHFAAANIFQTMIVIRELKETANTDMIYSLAANFKIIIPRLIYHLKNSTAFAEICQLLQQFTARIVI